MKKFILLMLLTSVMSAHAVGQASGQINTNQNEDSDEELNKAIELSLVDQDIEEEKKRENALSLSANTQKNNPVGEMQIDTFQRNVQQNNLGFDEDCEEEAGRKAIEKKNKEAIEKISKTLTPEEFALNSQNQRSIFSGSIDALAKQFSSLHIQDPIENTRSNLVSTPASDPVASGEEGQIDITIQPAMTESCKAVAKKMLEKMTHLQEIFRFFSTDHAHYITSLLNKKIHGHFDFDTKNDSEKNSHFKIQSVLTFNVVLPPDILEQLITVFKSRKGKSNPIQSLTLVSIQNVLALKEATQPPENEEAAQHNVSIGLVFNNWQNFWNAFRNNNPQNLPFNEWKTACFGAVSPEKFTIHLNDTPRIPQELINFFRANQDQLNPNNFMIAKNSLSIEATRFNGNPEILSHLTGVMSLECTAGTSIQISNEIFKTFFKNNAKTLENLDFSCNKLDAELCKTLSSSLSNLSSLKFLDLSYNNFGNDGVMDLASALAKTGGIKSLNLSANKIDSSGVLALMQIVSRLEQLNLSYNNIDDLGAMFLWEKVSSNKSTFKKLDLSRNSIAKCLKSELKEICRAKKINLKI